MTVLNSTARPPLLVALLCTTAPRPTQNEASRKTVCVNSNSVGGGRRSPSIATTRKPLRAPRVMERVMKYAINSQQHYATTPGLVLEKAPARYAIRTKERHAVSLGALRYPILPKETWLYQLGRVRYSTPPPYYQGSIRDIN